MISSVGGMTLGKGGVQIQVLGTNLTQMPAPQPPAPVQAQVKECNCILARSIKKVRFDLKSELFMFVHITDNDNEDAF